MDRLHKIHMTQKLAHHLIKRVESHKPLSNLSGIERMHEASLMDSTMSSINKALGRLPSNIDFGLKNAKSGLSDKMGAGFELAG